MEQNYLYIVFSSTPYKVGKMIRKVTRQKYNHVSIALDADLKQMYGFARRYYHTPLYGGFVRESTSRYHVWGKVTQIQLCRIPVSEKRYQALERRVADMYANKEKYLYNHLAAISSIFRRTIPIRDAYICVEFGVSMLHDAGMDIDPKKFYSVDDLLELMRPYTIYSGPIPNAESVDEAYYSEKPVRHPILTTVRDFLALFPRIAGK